MSEQLAFIRKKGGGLAKVTEKVLWTNPSPTSTFASQQITLSDDMTNYDYLKITYRANTSLATSASALMLVSEIIASANLASVPCMSIADRNSSANGYYMRGMSYISNTVISMGTCFQTGTSGSVNANVIPLQIIGLNIATDDKYTEYEIVALGSISTQATTVNISLNDRLSNYAYVVMGINIVATDKSLITANTTTSMLNGALDVEYFKRNSFESRYTTGSSGSGSYQKITYTYTSDTQITATRTDANTRTFSVYGIKATRKEPKKAYGTVTITNNSAFTPVNIGFRPKRLSVCRYVDSNNHITSTYDYDNISTTNYLRGYRKSTATHQNLYPVGEGRIGAIDLSDTGFSIYCEDSTFAGLWSYFAEA